MMSTWGSSEKSPAFIDPVQLCVSFCEHFLLLVLAIISENILVGSMLIILFCLTLLNLAFDH